MRWWSLALAVLAALALTATALADARTDYLIRVLRTSPMFRVRAQAAISLGSVAADPDVVEALTGALRDDHPAVRAAAASALERQGDPSCIPALQRARSDREAPVREAAARALEHLQRLARTQPRSRALPSAGSSSSGGGPARFYVAVGRPGTRVRSVSRETLAALQSFIEGQVRTMPGVRLAPANERPAAANRAISSGGLVGYYLDSSIVELEPRPGGGIHVRVSVVVQTYPGRDIRSMLNGAATVTAGSGDAVQRQVIEGALRGALRGLQPVMEAGAASAQASPGRRRR